MSLLKDQKIYRGLKGIELPDMVIRQAGMDTYTLKNVHYARAAYVRWPNGDPCAAINAYLLDICLNYTGDSVLTEASKLTHLIRYCFRNEINFRDLSDINIIQFSKDLCSEKYIHDDSQRVRNNNTVINIISSSLSFLAWYQLNLHIGINIIIGSRAEQPAIEVKTRLNRFNNRNYLYHRAMPSEVSTDPKLPIGEKVVEDIQGVIEDLHCENQYSDCMKRRFWVSGSFDVDLFELSLEYLTERRDFMVFMMLRTGLRPEEMVQMPLAENENSLRIDEPHFTLPTMKRRQLEPPPRSFPILIDDVNRVLEYLDIRKSWVNICKEKIPDYTVPDAMFLSTSPGRFGVAISKSGLAKDFEMLGNKAGYQDQQKCFSQFRHKFITDLVILHLKTWELGKNPLTKRDYRTLLVKVAEKTGHKDPKSLEHYIDLARDMDGTWEPIKQAEKIIQTGLHFRHDLRKLRREIQSDQMENKSAAQIIDIITQRLDDALGKTNKPI